MSDSIWRDAIEANKDLFPELFPVRPFACRSCGFSVPEIGTRREQAAVAVDHWFDTHE